MSDFFGNTSGLRLPGLEGIGALIESQNFDFSDKSIQTLDAMAESQIQSPGIALCQAYVLNAPIAVGHIMGLATSWDQMGLWTSACSDLTGNADCHAWHGTGKLTVPRSADTRNAFLASTKPWTSSLWSGKLEMDRLQSTTVSPSRSSCSAISKPIPAESPDAFGP